MTPYTDSYAKRLFQLLQTSKHASSYGFRLISNHKNSFLIHLHGLCASWQSQINFEAKLETILHHGQGSIIVWMGRMMRLPSPPTQHFLDDILALSK